MPYSIPPVIRVIVAAGHGLGNVHPFQYDDGATGCGYTEASLVSSIADQVVSATYPSSIIIIPAPECDNLCAKRHPRSGHLAYVVDYLNRHYLPHDYVISLHMNAADNDSASGVEVYHANGARYQRKKQAELVARILSEKMGLPNRGIFSSSESQHSKLAILDDTKAPSLLIELGFITNEADVEAVRSCGAEAVIEAIKALRGFQ